MTQVCPFITMQKVIYISSLGKGSVCHSTAYIHTQTTTVSNSKQKHLLTLLPTSFLCHNGPWGGGDIDRDSVRFSLEQMWVSDSVSNPKCVCVCNSVTVRACVWGGGCMSTCVCPSQCVCVCVCVRACSTVHPDIPLCSPPPPPHVCMCVCGKGGGGGGIHMCMCIHACDCTCHT